MFHDFSAKIKVLHFSENQCLEYETKIAKLEEDHGTEIAELKEKIAKLEKASTANQNLQSNGEYLSIKQ